MGKKGGRGTGAAGFAEGFQSVEFGGFNTPECRVAGTEGGKSQEEWGLGLDVCQNHLKGFKGAFVTVEKNAQRKLESPI